MGEKYTVARFTKDNEHFEVLVKPEKALDYRMGKTSAITEVLVTETTFSDANKGIRVSEEAIRKVFGTTEPLKVAEIILKRGTIQLTTEQRRKMIEDKRKQIAERAYRWVHENATYIHRIKMALDYMGLK